MWLLILGLVIWVGVHLLPTLGSSLRQSLIDQHGKKTYSIGFALAIFTSVVLMVLGWRSADQEFVYLPPESLKPFAMLLILFGFLFFGWAKAPTRIKQFVRHPQLTGVTCWAVGHLLANGDNLSVILFGTLGVWAIAEMFLINRREGAWVKPDTNPSIGAEIKAIVISLIVFTVFLFLHPYLIGVSPISG